MSDTPEHFQYIIYEIQNICNLELSGNVDGITFTLDPEDFEWVYKECRKRNSALAERATSIVVTTARGKIRLASTSHPALEAKVVH